MSDSNVISHSGHRARLRKRYLNSNAKGFSEHELLELLLFYSIPRANTNEIAHSLIERFGSVRGVMDASVDELKLVGGIGEKSAILINLTMMLAKEYTKTNFKVKQRIESLSDLVDYANVHTLGAVNELVCAVFLDDNLNIIASNVIAMGTVNEVRPLLRTVIELCVLKRATAVAIFHNHPNGGVEPSTEDIDFTILLERELKIIGVSLIEHVIVDGNDYIAILKMIKERY